VQQPIAWETVELAIHDWMAEATELETIWRNQSTPRPEYPYATLLIIAGPVRRGGRDEVRTETLSGQPQGEEVAVTTCGLREFTVSCQIYVAKPDHVNPEAHARSLMTAAQSNLGQLSTLARLRAAGLSVVEEGPVQNIDEVLEDAYVSRSNMDVRFYAAANVVERTGYIENAALESTSLKIDNDFGPNYGG
jgi:hypothetical protein